jgi:hypothetical protein
VQLCDQVVRLTGFHEDGRHAGAVRAFVDVGRPIGGHGHDGDGAGARLHAKIAGQRKAVASGQRNVGDDHVRH